MITKIGSFSDKHVIYEIHNQFLFLMSSFGIDIGGSQIKICVWNNNRTASTGVGSEVVPNNRDERTSPY